MSIDLDNITTKLRNANELMRMGGESSANDAFKELVSVVMVLATEIEELQETVYHDDE